MKKIFFYTFLFLLLLIPKLTFATKLDTNVSIKSLDFPPPEIGDVGFRIFTDAETPEDARKYVKQTYIPENYGEAITKTVTQKLGGNIGDSISFHMEGDWLFHNNWTLPTQNGIAESYYGKIRPENLIVVSDSDSIKTNVEKVPNKPGTFKITVTRVKESFDEKFNISIKYDYNFYYYESLYFFQKWGQWMEQPIEYISSVESIVEIKATPSKKKLTANINVNYLTLGDKFDDISPYNFVTDVKLDNKNLKDEDYSVTYLSGDNTTDTVGNKSFKVKVTLKQDTSIFTIVDSVLVVSYGNSIVFGGYDYYNDGRTTAAFTLKPKQIPSIVASQGKNDDNLQIHSNFNNEHYYSLDWFDLTKSKTILMSPTLESNFGISALGNDLKKDKLKYWGVGQEVQVNYGDIVRAFVTEKSKNWIYENEEKKSYTHNTPVAYYEITKNGYLFLNFNQLLPNNPRIPINTTTEYLDEHINEYINIDGYPNIHIKKFLNYPNTNNLGNSKGTILVEEKLTETGKSVEYVYDVNFDVYDLPTINVNFLNELNEVIAESITLKGEIGDTVDLTKNSEIQHSINELLESHFILTDSPIDEESIKFEDTSKDINYKFTGTLYLDSVPEYLDFKTQNVNFKKKLIKVQNPNYKTPLIIGDTRSIKNNWELTASLKTPLTSQQDTTNILPNAVKYMVEDDKELTLSQDYSQVVYKPVVSTDSMFNISNEWNERNTGVFIEINPNELNSLGKYKASILWQLQVAP